VLVGSDQQKSVTLFAYSEVLPILQVLTAQKRTFLHPAGKQKALNLSVIQDLA
jgi:hypothetical protein